MKTATLLWTLPLAALLALVTIALGNALAQDRTGAAGRGGAPTAPVAPTDEVVPDRNSPSDLSQQNKVTQTERGTTDAKPEAGKQVKSSRTSSARDVMGSLTVFVLAIFVGFELITKVPPTLHTPLMSGSNAISGITVVGAVLVAGSAVGGLSSLLGFVAVVLASVNVVGGFLVTHRMLAMFQKR